MGKICHDALYRIFRKSIRSRARKSFVVELGDNVVELLKGEAFVGGSLLAYVSAVHHLQDLVVIDPILELLSNCLELLEVNHSVLVLVEQSVDSLQAVSSSGLSDAGGNTINELVEVNGSVFVSKTVDKGQNEGVSAVEAEFLKDLVDFLGVNGATSILIKDFEGLLELVPVLSVEAVLPLSGGGLGGFS